MRAGSKDPPFSLHERNFIKLRLTEPGFENYTGQMGITFFEEGLSTTDVLQIHAGRMAAVMRCEWESGENPSVAQALLDHAHTEAPTFEPSGTETQTETEPQAETDPESQEPADTGTQTDAHTYTREELEAIADKSGIKGIREVAALYDLKGTSIADLIEQIIQASAGKA